MKRFNLNQIGVPSPSQSGDAGPSFGGIARKIPTALNLVGVVDATKSSHAFGQGIKSVFVQSAEILSATLADVTLGLHITRDLDYDRDANFSLGYQLTLEQFKSSMDRIAFEGGGDELETQFDAIQTVARTTPWDLSSTGRRVIKVGSTSGSKPTRDGMNVVQLAAELNALGIQVVTLAPKGVNLHALAAATGGISLELTNTPTPQDINQVVKLLTRSLTQMASSRGGGSGTMVIPPNTQFGHQGTQVLGAPA